MTLRSFQGLARRLGRFGKAGALACLLVGGQSWADPTIGAAQEIAALPIVEPAPTAGLSEADVERIVADYMARREAERQTFSSASFAPPEPPAGPKVPPPPEPYVVGSDTKLSAKWNNGLELQSANKDFKVHVGGRTQFDTSFFNADDYLKGPSATGGLGGIQPLQDSMQFRRARLRVDGTMYEQIEFAFEYEFLNDVSVAAGPPVVATTAPAATDVWVNFVKLPVLGSVKVGNQKPPIGLEHIQSSRFLDFIERSFNQDLFYGPFNNGFSPGIMASDVIWDKRATWATGVFAANMNGGTNIFGYGIGNDYDYCSRVTLLPYYEQDGRYLVHLGASADYRNADDGHVRVRTRGNIRNGPPGPYNAVYADTTYLIARGQSLANLEGIIQRGPFMIQSEYCFSTTYDAIQTQNVPAPVARGDVFSQGGYVEMLYFLTGEHRAYSHERAAFDRVVPYANSFRIVDRRGCVCRGPGAWQVGIRYDHADLNDSGINGGVLDAVTLGVNWFFNPNMKFQVNTDWTHRSSVGATAAGDVLGLGTRLAIDF